MALNRKYVLPLYLNHFGRITYLLDIEFWVDRFFFSQHFTFVTLLSYDLHGF